MKIEVKKKPVIHTESLSLKPCSEPDVSRLTELLTDRAISETYMVPDYETQEEFDALAKKLISLSRMEDTDHLIYGIYLQERLIGFVNDCGTEEDRIEIGYAVHPDYWGNGYATEAVTAILKELRGMGFKTVLAGYFEENYASRRVMEKCGMHEINRQETEEYRGVKHIL